MGKASEAILALNPVTFHYKSDTTGTSPFGLIAEEVAEVNPALVVQDKEGKPYTVRYDQVNAMLLNEFLKEHRKGEDQDLAISQLKSTLAQEQKTFEAKLAQQEQQIAALKADLQRLAADIELNRAESRTLAEK
jgi:trimeric autotransporter adhesin